VDEEEETCCENQKVRLHLRCEYLGSFLKS
jgi:hypothetical protein